MSPFLDFLNATKPSEIGPNRKIQYLEYDHIWGDVKRLNESRGIEHYWYGIGLHTFPTFLYV